ncbi:MAG: hypothetical protein II953_00750 [Clostridia bacterium]|nr:hypothetical protein [Clostridia bacterium]
MACFLVPAAEAIVTTVASKAAKKNTVPASEAESRITFGSKLSWLNNLLWGGSALLAFEHVWHGEITPFFPFLTAAAEGETVEMLKEMGTVGVGMAVLVTGVWAGMVLIAKAIEKRPEPEEAGPEAAEAQS